ncbi:NADAR family protein, partial [Salmonella sp. SAL4358]|uniref:NADAR family protein n=1 Tax=Salmonella sp. SAL4358 TaxID=3159879 RepID=UPI003978ECE8
SLGQYYEAEKFKDVSPVVWNEIQGLSPEDMTNAVAIAENQARFIDPHWDYKKEEALAKAIKAKFMDNEDLQKQLKATQGKTLVYQTGDTYL